MSQKPLDDVRSRSRMRTRPLIAITALTLVFGFASAATAAPLVGTTARISVDSAGTQGNNGSSNPAVSGDGRYITYESEAGNLVVGDTNLSSDIFLFDRTTATTTRVSVATGGGEADGGSFEPSISSDGTDTLIAYVSEATNLVAGDTNGFFDVFIYSVSLAITTRISVGPGGIQSDNDSQHPSISGDGDYIAYASLATNLVAGDANGQQDVFLFDLDLFTSSRISVDSAGPESNDASSNPAISGDGRYITYQSRASNLVVDDTNGLLDLFLFDRLTTVTTRISVDSSGAEGNGRSYQPSISGDGRYLTYWSDASNLVADDVFAQVDVFLFDRVTTETSRISVDSAGAGGNASSSEPSISADGRYITYYSDASNLVAADTNLDTDVFLFDRTTLATIRISVDSAVTQSNGASFSPAISGDGRYITYYSRASNLVASDSNGADDVFLVELSATPTLAATGSDPIAPLAIAALLLGVGVFAVSCYRRHRTS